MTRFGRNEFQKLCKKKKCIMWDWQRMRVRTHTHTHANTHTHTHTKVQKQLQVKSTKMTMTGTNRVQFASLNNKWYYFLDGIVSLPFGHALLSDLWELKKILFESIYSHWKRKRQIIKIKKSSSCKKWQT